MDSSWTAWKKQLNPLTSRALFPTKPMGVRLGADYLEAIQQVAEREGVPYQMLVQRWLMEKLALWEFAGF